MVLISSETAAIVAAHLAHADAVAYGEASESPAERQRRILRVYKGYIDALTKHPSSGGMAGFNLDHLS